MCSMRKSWIISDAIVSPLGQTSEENFLNVRKGKTGITVVSDRALTDLQIPLSVIESIQNLPELTRFEALTIAAIRQAIGNLSLPEHKTVFILSTTKGNIELLGRQQSNQRLSLHATANFIASKFGFSNVVVVSNACISGVLALLTAQRFISSGKFDHAVVAGSEVLSRFIIGGFQSLHALSSEACRPFDKDRAGITLGEASGVVVLSCKPESFYIDASFEIAGGAVSNDANHISGPSRTGEELAGAIKRAAKISGEEVAAIDFISAHGTATIFNDEMEALAFSHAGLTHVPLNSLKGYFGHTLGAAGIIETIISRYSMIHSEVIPSKGFIHKGVSPEVNVADAIIKKNLRVVLKTASGFGGCNAALILRKN
jgi:3-oxoacyl-[acyl-carrier-protein] synthase-1